jgi:CRP-like cAMP-binding protein
MWESAVAPDPKPVIFRNKLLQTLAEEDRAVLTPHLTAVDLPLRKELEWPNKPIRDVYFFESGIASVIARTTQRKELEIGMFGRDGMSGIMVVLGNDRSPNSTFMQVAGHGQRINADDLRSAMDERPTIRLRLLRLAQAFMIQASHTAISNGSAKLEERLARWLLMTHDRIDGDEMPLVHDFIARMLGVRRAGVTVALQSLEGYGVIKTGRAHISVVDRKGMIELANGTYGIPESEYARLIGEEVGGG